MKKEKAGYIDIIIYTVVILGLLILNKEKIIGYNLLVIFLVIALAAFALYNLRHQISKALNKKKN